MSARLTRRRSTRIGDLLFSTRTMKPSTSPVSAASHRWTWHEC
jgi:hypothetical protein